MSTLLELELVGRSDVDLARTLRLARAETLALHRRLERVEAAVGVGPGTSSTPTEFDWLRLYGESTRASTIVVPAAEQAEAMARAAMGVDEVAAIELAAATRDPVAWRIPLLVLELAHRDYGSETLATAVAHLRVVIRNTRGLYDLLDTGGDDPIAIHRALDMAIDVLVGPN